ncbi:MAG: hypothetical protein ABSH41_09855, partial [Syntrophobacteraceae bacterium]
YARLVMAEVFGPKNYIGSFVWRAHYSPKGGKDSNEIAAIHQPLICFAKDRSILSRLALPQDAEGFSNPDGDPREDWRAAQKDAGRDTVRLVYNVPPYRWEMIAGELPPGIWRVSPMSGVIWGVPERSGLYEFTVRVADSHGNSSTKKLTLEVRQHGESGFPIDVWWRTAPAEASASELSVCSDSLAPAVIGKEYSAVIQAKGGIRFAGQPRPSRGWGFGEKTLIRSILEDSCYFGQKGTSIPQPKTYLKRLPEGQRLVNLSSWWDGAEVGWSQDATKHLKEMESAGFIQRYITTAKPESLMSRLLDAFTQPGEIAVELFGNAGDLSATALKKNRRFVLLSGASDYDHEILEKCALGRLRAVIDGKDNFGSETEESQPKKTNKKQKLSSLPNPGGGAYKHFTLGKSLAIQDRHHEFPYLLSDNYGKDSNLCNAILTSEGFIPQGAASGIFTDIFLGVSLGGKIMAFLLAPSKFLDQATAGHLYSVASEEYKHVIIYYFRSADDFEAPQGANGASFKRVPMDLTK